MDIWSDSICQKYTACQRQLGPVSEYLSAYTNFINFVHFYSPPRIWLDNIFAGTMCRGILF